MARFSSRSRLVKRWCRPELVGRRVDRDKDRLMVGYSLFAAACGMMEKEHGGACADLGRSRVACYPTPVSCLVVSGAHRPLFSYSFSVRGSRSAFGRSHILCAHREREAPRGIFFELTSRYAGATTRLPVGQSPSLLCFNRAGPRRVSRS